MNDIKIQDDGSIVVTKQVTTIRPIFTGTIEDLENDEIPELYKRRDAIQAEIDEKEAIVTQATAAKLKIQPVVEPII